MDSANISVENNLKNRLGESHNQTNSSSIFTKQIGETTDYRIYLLAADRIPIFTDMQPMGIYVVGNLIRHHAMTAIR